MPQDDPVQDFNATMVGDEQGPRSGGPFVPPDTMSLTER